MLDPRTKFLATVGVIAATFLTKNVGYFTGIGVLLAICLLISKTPWRVFIRNVLFLSWLFAVTFFTYLWGEISLSPQEPGIHGISVGDRVIPYEGLIGSLLTVGQLMVVVGWVTILGSSTSPLEMVTGLERLLRPLRGLGVPVQNLSIVAMLSIRFIPILFEERQYLMRAYIARGIDLNSGNILVRAKHYVLLCVPLFNSLLRRAEQLTLAMESRAFQARVDRTSLGEFRMRFPDYLVLGGSIVLVVFAQVVS